MGWLGEIVSGLFGTVQQGSQMAFDANQSSLNREFQAKEADKNRDFQSFEAAAQRDWSSQEAERARDWNEEMYAKYNSLQGKISQAEQAGVNPMFAVTGNSVSPMSASASVPSGASAGSVGTPSGDSASMRFVDIIGQILGIKQTESQMDVNEALASKYRSEAANIDKNTSWIDRLNEASVSMTDADIKNTLKDIEVKENAILVGEAEIEVKASEASLNKIVGSLRNMEATKIREMLPYIKALNEAETEEARSEAAYKLAAATLAGEQASRTDTGETLDVVNTVVDGIGDTVTTGVLIADMIGEVFGVEDAGQRWQETKRYERDSKGRVISETRSGDGKSKKVSSKRRKRR